nr:hypothetical protein [Escherichia coli]
MMSAPTGTITTVSTGWCTTRGHNIQDGDLDVSGGGHGIDITGDSATVDNKGTMTVTDPESIGIQIMVIPWAKCAW